MGPSSSEGAVAALILVVVLILTEGLPLRLMAEGPNSSHSSKKMGASPFLKGEFKEWKELGGTLGSEPPATEASHTRGPQPLTWPQ